MNQTDDPKQPLNRRDRRARRREAARTHKAVLDRLDRLVRRALPDARGPDGKPIGKRRVKPKRH